MHENSILGPGHTAADLAATARRLLAAQYPQWAELACTPLKTAGTVNAIVRVGDDLVMRLPLQKSDPAAQAETLAAEGRAAAECGAAASVPVSQLVALGQPDAAYPAPWALYRWLPGQVATPASGSVALAEDLAVQIAAWRGLDTRGRAFSGVGRGGEFTAHDDWVETCLQRSAGLIDTEGAARLWAAVRDLPRPERLAMTHGDLTPFNLVLGEGRLTGLLDAGGFGPTDPALDLVCAWHVLDAEARAHLRERLQCSDLEWQRGAGWALEQALGLVWYYAASNPPMAALGRSTITRLLRDASLGFGSDARVAR